MPEVDVLYSDVKFTKSREKANGTVPPSEDTTYSEVKIAKAPPLSTELIDPQQQAGSTGPSGATLERVAVVVLLALLVAAVTGLGYTTYKNMQTTEQLQKLKDDNDALKKNLTDRTCSKIPCIILKPTCPIDKTCLKCEAGWEPFGEKCYYFSTQKSTWNQSRDECKNQGADLVKIDSKKEQIFLDVKLRDKMEVAEDKFWIGLTDSEKEDEWKWVDGSPLNKSLTFWSRNEPDNWRGNDEKGEDCARMGERGGAEEHKIWFDQGCENSNKHICEKSSVKGKHKCE
ncbi:hepatic lectin-like isoform X2 [Notolabrus celidotus]|uniref:hepatic lectin-like isoform X2 n=1 Tax=Notolabrus celidotus TaxID=1203425 RepID=UPI00148FDDEE|nr:hepatic lectin-like isoform X2 [Notolabrus celidotus]